MKRVSRLSRLSQPHSMAKLRETRKLPLRPAAELRHIEREYGSACMAAFDDQLSPEEYLKLEALSEH
jgi:hypothetical protein